MLKTSATIFVATIFSLSFVGATPADAKEKEKARQGFVRCEGNNFLSLSNTQEQTTNLGLRNFDGMRPITITGLRIYNALGALIYDSAVSGLPAFNNGILGPGNNTLSPYQSSILSFDAFLPYLAQSDRPIQIFVTWSSPVPVLPLGVNSTIVVRERNPVSGNVMPERSRHSNPCEAILVP